MSTGTKRGPSTASVRAADYLLYRDWCDATRVSLAATTTTHLTRFTAFTGGADATRRRRLRNIVASLHADGINVLVEHQAAPVRVWHDGDDWLDVEDALERCPVLGWPDGLHGRRDAFLIVLVGHLGWSREQVRRLNPCDVEVESGTVVVTERPAAPASGSPGCPGASTSVARLVGTDKDPLRCPSCAVTRWLRVLAMCDLGRGEARQHLVLARQRDQRSRHDHQIGMADWRWQDAAHLLPPIDQYGYLDVAPDGISARTISRIVAARQQALTPVLSADEDDDQESTRAPEPGVYADLEWDELDARLDEICSAADEVLAAVADHL